MKNGENETKWCLIEWDMSSWTLLLHGRFWKCQTQGKPCYSQRKFSSNNCKGENLKDVKINVNDPHAWHTTLRHVKKVCVTLKTPRSSPKPFFHKSFMSRNMGDLLPDEPGEANHEQYSSSNSALSVIHCSLRDLKSKLGLPRVILKYQGAEPGGRHMLKGGGGATIARLGDRGIWSRWRLQFLSSPFYWTRL